MEVSLRVRAYRIEDLVESNLDHVLASRADLYLVPGKCPATGQPFNPV
jgi:hypothetical protein